LDTGFNVAKNRYFSKVNIALAYLNYLIRSKRRHGIHSPFVYALQDECLSIKLTEETIQEKKALFNALASDNSLIQVNDYGAGSKKLASFRRVNKIFKISSSKGKYGNLLYCLSTYFKPKYILELGTSLGVGTFHLRAGNVNTHITTVEGCEQTMLMAQKYVRRTHAPSISFIHSTFDHFLDHFELPNFDLIFVDGHHDGKALLRYMEKLTHCSHEQTIFVLDDIRWSTSMLEAWKILISSNEYHLSIDFFRVGILMRRPNQAKEHFVLRF